MPKKKNAKEKKCQKNVRKEFLDKFLPIIELNGKDLPTFYKTKKYLYEDINTNSWFNINKYTSKKERHPIVVSSDKLEESNYKLIKVNMELKPIHKKIFQNWFKVSTLIYNETLNYIKTNYNFTKKEIIRNQLINAIKEDNHFINKIYIRNQMKDIKNRIKKEFTFIIDKEDTITKKNDILCSIDIHTLDKSIFQLIQNIKSSVSNMLNGHIKKFRLKFWKYTRPSKVIELEKNKISDGILCKSIFKHLEGIKYYYNNNEYDLNNIKCDFKINYNSIQDKYYLLVPVKIENQELSLTTNKMIVLDPGLRTFMTGLSNNEFINIAPKVNYIIQKDIKRLNIIKKNDKIPSKIKKKNERIINKKIENKITDMHWKVINYLTDNYDTIFLGDMSAKSIVKKSNSVLSKTAKVACLRTRYYDFQLKLKYKCSLKKRNFKLVNEYYTSKTCSLCGNYNEKLKAEVSFRLGVTYVFPQYIVKLKK